MLSIIVAVSKNGVIGQRGSLPWYLPADLKRFKKLTTGHPIIMGRKTYESIGKPLPERTNIVITRKNKFNAPGSFVVFSLDEAIRLASKSPGSEEVFIIGGAEIFKQTISTADRLYITFLNENIDGDVLMPEIDFSKWQEIKRKKFSADDANLFDYEFADYQRLPSEVVTKQMEV